MPKPSAYAPQPARSQVSVHTPSDGHLLPVSLVALPHLRRPCLLAARADKAYWDLNIRDFLPVLDQIPLRPGANGCGNRKDADGVLVEDVTHIVSDLQRMRWRVIVNGDPVLEPIRRGGRFLETYSCERGLAATVPFWESPDVVSRDREIRWRMDTAARRGFIDALLRHRLIDPITAEARREIYAQATGTLGELIREERQRAARGTKSADLEADIKRLEVRCAHMEARLEGGDPFELEAEPEIEKRRGRARRVTDPQIAAPEPEPAPTQAAAGMVTMEEARRMAGEAARAAVAEALAALKPAPRRRKAPDAK